MKLIQAKAEELPVILDFYNKVIDNTKDMEKYARWKKEMHPKNETIKAYLDKEAMYLYINENTIVGALAITLEQDEDYHNIMWKIEAKDDEVAVIHILCVSADYQGKGIGKELIDEVIQFAKAYGKKAVRLDALASNTPAQHMYEEKGFQYISKQNLFADNTGWTDFFFYERIL